MILYIDTETYSATPINYGTYRYTSDCEVMLVTWAVDDGPVQCWDRTEAYACPSALNYEINDPSTILVAHNAMFDRNTPLLRHIPIPRWRCSMARALAHGLPGGLDKLGEVLEVAEAYSKKDGRSLIHLFCKPNKDGTRNTRHTHPKEWEEFKAYAIADVVAMREVWKRLPEWNYRGKELALWHLDQEINDRGFEVDVEFAEAAVTAVTREQAALSKAVQDKTEFDPAQKGVGVESATQRDKMLAYILQEYGVDLPDMTASTLERRINDEKLPLELRELLALRLQATTTSTAKYRAVTRGHVNGRLCGTSQFCGASRTGRWAHRSFQPGNLPRPKHKRYEIDEGIEMLKAGCADLLLPDVMAIASSSLRGVIIAKPGRKLVVADLRNIEGRKAAEVAGEQWKLDAFRAYDEGRGEDLYKVAYGRSFRIDPAVIGDTDPRRQIGKVQELMLQYGGGVGAFATGAMTYGIDLEDLARTAWETIPSETMRETVDFVNWQDKQPKPIHYPMSREARIVCDALKRMWRAAHPGIVSIWRELEDAVTIAINSPGTQCDVRGLKIRRDGTWLRIRLHSGRYLCYPSPRVSAKGGITYMGVNQYTRQWARLTTYGGKLFENVIQAESRDVLADALPRAEAAGYLPVLTVHDEGVTETPDTDHYTVDGLCRILSAPLDWAPNLPLAAAGFEGYRYGKH